MKKNYILSLALMMLLFNIRTQGQQLKQVLFSTGGSFQAPGNKVKLYSYNPASSSTSIIDSVYGDYSNDLVLDSSYAYLHVGRSTGSPAGYDVVMKYDLATGNRIDSITNVQGAQRILVTPSHVVLTFGYGASNGFLRAYSKSTLDQVYSDTALAANTSDAAFLNDSLYVGHADGTSGTLTVYKMNPPSYVRTVSFDTLSAGITGIKKYGNNLVILSERYNFSTWSVDYGAITKFIPSTSAYTSVETQEGHGMIGFINDTLLAEFGNGNAYDLDPISSASIDIPVNYTDAAFDATARKFYVQETDFWSSGSLKVFSFNGTLLDSVSTDISGSAITLDYLNNPLSSGIQVKKKTVRAYPNPARDIIYFENVNSAEFLIYNIQGMLIKKGRMENSLFIGDIPAGYYFAEINEGGNIFKTSFIRHD